MKIVSLANTERKYNSRYIDQLKYINIAVARLSQD